MGTLHTLFGRGTGVVLITPYPVPHGRDDEETNEDDRGVVHGFLRNGHEGGHGEERDGEAGPC